jgi:hypothetical protein
MAGYCCKNFSARAGLPTGISFDDNIREGGGEYEKEYC